VFGSCVLPQCPNTLLTDTGSVGGGGPAAPSAPRRRRDGVAAASACTDAVTRSSASNTAAAPARPPALPPPCILNLDQDLRALQQRGSSTGRERSRVLAEC